MPLATAVGKMMYAKRVNGACRIKNRAGGMTNRKLNQKLRRITVSKYITTHRSIGI